MQGRAPENRAIFRLLNHEIIVADEVHASGVRQHLGRGDQESVCNGNERNAFERRDAQQQEHE